MKLVKTLSLAAIATVATMAVVGVSTASAENTVLCDVHTELGCPFGHAVENKEVAMELSTEKGGPGGEYGLVGKLLNSLATILCLGLEVSGEALELGSPQEIHGTKFDPTGCGTNSTHTNCLITEEEPSLFLLLKTGLDQGTLTAAGGIFHVVCTNVGIFKVKIDCKYNVNGLKFSVSGAHITAEKTHINIIEGSFFCPGENKLDWLLKTTEPFYVTN